MSEFIHILLLKVELGPYSEKQVQDALAAGHLLPTDSARFEPNKEWKPLSEVLAHLPQPIIFAPPVSDTQSQPQTIAPAVVLIAPAPTPLIIEAPVVAEFVPDALQPAVVLIAPAPVPSIVDAPAIAEFVAEPLRPAVILFSPLLPARQLLPTPKMEIAVAQPAPDPAATEIVSTPPLLPAPQQLQPPKESEPTQSPQEDSTLEPPAVRKPKGREITPPPEPVVPYNQPIPRPAMTALEHWHAWGKYAAPVLVLLLVIICMSWKMLAPSLAYFWADVNFAFIQLLDNIIASFTVRPVQ